MKNSLAIFVLLIGFTLFVSCTKEQKLSREEIPLIKQSLIALEHAIAAKNTIYIDSLLSSDASEAGTSPQAVLDLIYSAGLREFTGFTQKEIVFRGDAARVDCFAIGEGGSPQPVTITMRKENGLWLLKRIEPRQGVMFKDEGDTTGK